MKKIKNDKIFKTMLRGKIFTSEYSKRDRYLN